MDQVTNFIILAVVLVVLIALVAAAFYKRAKNDPDSLKNEFYDFKEFDEFELYEEVARYDDTQKVSRANRPKYPNSNDYREWLAMMEERNARKPEESLEELELW